MTDDRSPDRSRAVPHHRSPVATPHALRKGLTVPYAEFLAACISGGLMLGLLAALTKGRG